MEVFVVMAFITFCIFMVGVCKLAVKESKGNKRIPVRNIPDSYFKGYRRLANTRSDVKEKKCWTCKHAVAYRTWHCDLAPKSCSYEMCYIKDEITPDDYKAGVKSGAVSRWVGLPPNEN